MLFRSISAKELANANIDERKLFHTEAIIKSMTADERENRVKLTPSRRERIAKGSGTTVADVNALIKQFDQMGQMMKRMTGKNGRNAMLGGGGDTPGMGGGLPRMGGHGMGKHSGGRQQKNKKRKKK